MATHHVRANEVLAQQQQQQQQQGGVLLDDPDYFLKEIVRRVLQQVLEAEMTEHT